MGRTLAPGTPPERGDLIFWKGHVGIMLDATRLLHCNAHHMALARCTRNALIVWMMEKMHEVRSHAQWARMRTITLEPAIIARYNRQHRGIVDAIRARDAEAAGRLMKEHLETARRSLVEATS